MTGRADDFHEALQDSLNALRENAFDKAEGIIEDALKDDPLRCEIEKERELALLLDEWRGLPMPRPDFLTFAHSKRKWSRR